MCRNNELPPLRLFPGIRVTDQSRVPNHLAIQTPIGSCAYLKVQSLLPQSTAELNNSTSVTRRLDYLCNIWPFATKIICPTANIFCQRRFKISPNTKQTIKNCHRLILNFAQSGHTGHCMVYRSCQRTLTYFERGSISVRLTSCLTGLDPTKLVYMYLIQHT